MIPIDADTGRSARRSSRVRTPGFRCGSSPVSSSTAPGGAREVLERRRAAERRKLLARGAVAQLGLVAEGEQRLAAARGRARARDLQHLVDRQVRALAAPRRRRERAVVADVAAELRQRDEHLRRVRDEPVARASRTASRLAEQLVRRQREQLQAVSARRGSLRHRQRFRSILDPGYASVVEAATTG